MRAYSLILANLAGPAGFEPVEKGVNGMKFWALAYLLNPKIIHRVVPKSVAQSLPSVRLASGVAGNKTMLGFSDESLVKASSNLTDPAQNL
jgi:hypothetical protein